MKGINILPFWGEPCLGVLWYVRALLVLILIAPVLVWIVRRSRLVASIFLVCVFVLFQFQRQLFPWQEFELSLSCVLYFSVGLVACQYHLLSYVQRFSLFYAILGFGWFGLHYFGLLQGSCVVITMPLAILATVAGIWGFLPDVRLPVLFQRSSFAIYVMHPMLIYLIGSLCKAVGLWRLINTDVGIFATVSLYVLIASSVNYMAKTHYPRIAKLFFGGR